MSDVAIYLWGENLVTQYSVSYILQGSRNSLEYTWSDEHDDKIPRKFPAEVILNNINIPNGRPQIFRL